MAEFKVALIGCGGIANGKHLPNLARVREVSLVAFCDIIVERAQEAAEKYGAPGAKAYASYRELLEKEKPDVVHVCTPNISHSEISIAAMESGCHVLCEKPMAINEAEAKAMLDTAKRTGKKLTIGYQNRFTPEAQYIKAECDRGTLGEIYFAKAHAVRRRAVPTWGVFLDESQQGGGPLVDIGTHALDMTLWMMENYKPKYCVGSSFHKLADYSKQDRSGNIWGDWKKDEFKVEDSCFGFVVMENGATIFLESSWALNTLDVIEASTTLCGTLAGADMRGGVRINGVRNGRQYVSKPDFAAGGVAFIEGDASPSPALYEAVQWYNALRDGKDPCVLPEQAYTVSAILDGIYNSSASGQPHYFK